MEANNKVAIIGHFGGNKSYYDGQTIKTKIFYETLSQKTKWSIDKIDTNLKKTNPFKLLFLSIFSIHKYDVVFIMTSSRGLKTYLPLLRLYLKNKKHKVFHVVIGGSLDAYIKDHPKMLKTMKQFTFIFAETNILKSNLNNLGLTNVEILPNFKTLKALGKPKNCFEKNDVFTFCIFSRISKEKGVSDAIYAISNIIGVYDKVTLDIFGPIEKQYEDEFQRLLSEYKFVKYRGIIEQGNVVATLSQYYCLLFPTHWIGEGFPGTILDAYLSGVPVIASDWNSNKEVLKDNYTGIIYPSEKSKTLEEAIIYSIKNKDKFLQMRFNCLEEAKKYDYECLISSVIQKIESYD